MASPVAEHASSATAESPFLRGSLTVFALSPREQTVGEVFMHISGDARFVRTSSSPQHADDFANCDVVIDLKRVANGGDDSDDEVPPSNRSCSSEALKGNTIEVVGPTSASDAHVVSIVGHVTVRDQNQGSESGQCCVGDKRFGKSLLTVDSREERDVLLLLLRARVASIKVWHGVCCTGGPKCGAQSHARLVSFFHERSAQASQRKIVDALRSERSRWARDNAGAPEHCGLPYGEGSADDVSDAALLVHASVMQVMELGSRVGAAASMSTFEAWHEGAAALRSIKDSSKLVCTVLHTVTSAVMAGKSDASMGSVLDALIGCWDCLLVVEASLRNISSTSTVSDDVKELVHAKRKTIQEHALTANLAQLAVTPRPASAQDSTYQASFRVDIPCSLAAAKEGSPQYEAILDKLLNTDATDDLQPVAVTSVSGEGGAGKTTTCVLALRNARLKRRFKDGVIGFEIGLDAQANDIIRKIANIVEYCHGVSIAQSIRSLTTIEEAADEAQRFFSTRIILLYLDNVWPDNRCLENLMSIASGPGSCVLFSTRSAALAQDYSEQVVDLGTLQLDVPEGRAAAAAIFYRHLGPQRSHRWCTEANVNEALSLSRGLPIAIATLAALIRNKLVRRVTSNVLGQVARNLHSPPMSTSRNVKHQGLFAAMRESLEFLDRQHSATNEDDGGSQGLMTRRYASLHALDRSENRIDASVLSIVWDTSLEDAEETAGEFFNFGLVTLATPGAATSEENVERPLSDTLTLHDLQVDYSAYVANSGQHGISVEDVHETAVRGMFDGNVDIDALTGVDFVSRCEDLCQADEASEYKRGRYVVSNVVRHLIGSLTLDNESRRWPTIRRLLSDARWLMLWQSIDGWSYVCNRYTTLQDALSVNEGVLGVLPDAEVEAVVEIGRTGQTVPVASRSQHRDDEVKKAAVEMYSRLYATWLERVPGVSRSVLQRTLQSLSVIAGQWWARPMVACHEPPVRDRRLRTMFVAPRGPVCGCALIGSNGYVVTGSEDGVVRVHDGVGAVVARHRKHSRPVYGVCVGRPRSDTEYRVFSVSGGKRTLVRWDVSLPTATGGLATAVKPVVVASTETSPLSVACSDDASVVVAGCQDGVVYFWAFGGDDSQPADVSEFSAQGHTNEVSCVAVSSDGAMVLSGSLDGRCRVWAVADAMRGDVRLCSPAVLGDGSPEHDTVWSCAFARADRVAVTGHWSGAVRFWSLADATLLGEVHLQSGMVRSLAAIGRAGDEVVAGTKRGTAHVVRVSDRALTAQLGREDVDPVRSVSASRDDTRTVICGHQSGQVKVWDARRSSDGGATDAGTHTRPQRPRHSYWVYTVSASSCGRFVVSGGEDGIVRCWRADTGRELWTRDCGSDVNCVCVSADATHVACGCLDGTVRVLEMANGEVVCEWKHDSTVGSVCMHELGDDLVWSGHDGEIVAWSRDTSTPAHRVQGLHGNWVTALGVAAGGKCVYSLDGGGCTARTEIPDDVETSTTIVDESSHDTTTRSRDNAFAELSAQGFRIGIYECRHLRARHAHGGRVHELAATAPELGRALNIDLRLPDGTETAITTPTFENIVYAVDASFVVAADGSCSFAQVVCGLGYGNVCILRQPLAEDNQHWHPAESLQ